MWKVQKVESAYIQSDCETTSKKRTDSSYVFTRSGKYKTVKNVNTQNGYEAASNKWTGKKKTNLFCEIPRKQVQDCSKEFLGNSNKKKRFLGKATNHNDHYMINIGGQRLKIGSNWPFTSPYLQRWVCMKFESLRKFQSNIKK